MPPGLERLEYSCRLWGAAASIITALPVCDQKRAIILVYDHTKPLGILVTRARSGRSTLLQIRVPLLLGVFLSNTSAC